MGLGTNLALTPKYTGHRNKEAVTNVQTRIDELLAGQNELNTDTVVELNRLKAILNDLTGYSSQTTADAVKDDTTITVADAKGFEAEDEIIINDTAYTIDSIDGNDITLTSGLVEDVVTDTKVIKNSTLDITSINEKMQTLADIFSKSGTANDVFDALVILANAWNASAKIVDTVKGVFDSETGTLDIDVSNFGFASTTDFNVVGSTNALGALKASVGFDKVDENTITITAYDKACFVEDEIPFNAKDNSFDVTIHITYSREHLAFSITDEDGTVIEVA